MIRKRSNLQFDLYSRGIKYGVAWVDAIPGSDAGNFHIEIFRFGLEIFNRMQRDRDSLFDYIRPHYQLLMAFVREEDVAHNDLKLWKKFVRLFGFERPALMTYRGI